MNNLLQSILQLIGCNPTQRKYKQKVMQETSSVNFSSITHDWLTAKQLYDVLKLKCHPDKFSGELEEEATHLFQRIMQNKYNYAELLKVKADAIVKLGISID